MPSLHVILEKEPLDEDLIEDQENNRAWGEWIDEQSEQAQDNSIDSSGTEGRNLVPIEAKDTESPSNFQVFSIQSSRNNSFNIIV